jgi:hypothetical protein
MRYLLSLVVLAALVPGVTRGAAPQNAEPASRPKVIIKIEDETSAPIKGELVIIQNLHATEREILRALTDDNGDAPALDLQPGLYRLIVATPYGLWKTEIREFLVVEGRTKQIEVRVFPLPTHGYGDVIPAPGPKIQAQVLTSDGQPASEALVLARDKEDTLYLERHYTTDAKGLATIELVGAPLNAPTVIIVVYRDILVTQEVAKGTRSLVIHLPEH